MLRNDQTRYGGVAQILHWLIAALIALMYGLGWYMKGLPLGQHKYDVYVLHKSLGLTIFALVVVRLAWRLISPPPPLPPTMPAWERLAARLSHGALYALLLIQPMIGFVHSNATNFPVVVWGTLPLPPLIGPEQGLGEPLAGAHEIVARIILVIVGLHVAAALRHHVVLKDDILRRMLPGTRLRGS